MTGLLSFDTPDIANMLRLSGISTRPGLTQDELTAAEMRFGVAFNPEHRFFLSQVSPVGRGWWDWRSDDEALRLAIARPVDDILDLVGEGRFWPSNWGERPAKMDERVRLAKAKSSMWAPLVPLNGHRYVPQFVADTASPVYSIVGSDVIVYAQSIHEYLFREYGGLRPRPVSLDDDAADNSYSPWSTWAVGEEG